jgi:filamentous hemagglutinin
MAITDAIGVTTETPSKAGEIDGGTPPGEQQDSVFATGGSEIQDSSGTPHTGNDRLGFTGSLNYINDGGLSDGEKVGLNYVMSKSEDGKVAKKGTFPDEVFTGKKPHQTTPGRKTVTQERYNPEAGKLEKSEITYDKYGRQESRVDYTNHGHGDASKPKEYHSDSHTHTYEYGSGYGPKGKEMRINN